MEEANTNNSSGPTSLRFLQLKDAFQRFATVGLDCVDYDTFGRLFAELPPRLLPLLWDLYRKVMQQMLANANVEFDAACAEVGLAEQLEELEALCLQRGVSADLARSGDATTAPTAAEAMARVAAKQAEKQQLQEALKQVSTQQQQLAEAVAQRQLQRDSIKENFAAAAQQVKQVYTAAKPWLGSPLTDTNV